MAGEQRGAMRSLCRPADGKNSFYGGLWKKGKRPFIDEKQRGESRHWKVSSGCCCCSRRLHAGHVALTHGNATAPHRGQGTMTNKHAFELARKASENTRPVRNSGLRYEYACRISFALIKIHKCRRPSVSKDRSRLCQIVFGTWVV